MLEQYLSRLWHHTVVCSKGRMMSPHGKVHGKATESTVEILYQLGTHQDDGLRTRYVWCNCFSGTTWHWVHLLVSV